MNSAFQVDRKGLATLVKVTRSVCGGGGLRGKEGSTSDQLCLRPAPKELQGLHEAKPNQGTVWPLQVPTLGRRWESKTDRGTGKVREDKRPDEGSRETEWLPSKGGFSMHLQDPTV